MTSPAHSPNRRAKLAATIEAPHAQNLIIALILVNAAILGLETSPAVMAGWGGLLMRLDQAILAVFAIELAIRILAHGWRFFRDPWSVFDFTVVAIALLPATGPFAVLRALRVLRVLRLLTMVPDMRRVVGGLLAAIPGLASVFGILSIIFYVAAVIATKLFGSDFPEWFGSLGSSAYTLFQVMTMDSWSTGITRPIMETFPQAWIFFILFILVSTFTMLNLFIAVIVNAIQAEHDTERQDRENQPAAQPAETSLREEIRALRGELQELRRALQLRGGA
ncbi:MAG: ion transporter [Burkholderiales bacterium]|nr:ion transporter [Burkholderiales bacterium]